MKFKKKEPYRTLAMEAIVANDITLHHNRTLSCSEKTAYYIAKSSGLRSKKKRHIVKRFKKIIKESIKEFIKNYG